MNWRDVCEEMAAGGGSWWHTRQHCTAAQVEVGDRVVERLRLVREERAELHRLRREVDGLRDDLARLTDALTPPLHGQTTALVRMRRNTEGRQ
jgi:hypothetical protein